MTHLTLQINNSILEHCYNEEKNIMIKLQHQTVYFPIFISFHHDKFVSFHFFPPDDTNYNEKIESALATVILYNENNFNITKESWGLFSPSHPIVVMFPIRNICKPFENINGSSRKCPLLSLKCEPNYPIPFYIAYDYLFPSEKLVYKSEEIDNSCLVSLIKVFGVLFLKTKKHIFKENIEKCYYQYYANPSKNTFNAFFYALSDYSSQSTDNFNAIYLFNSSNFDEKDVKKIIDLMLDKDAITIIDQENEKCLLIKPNEDYITKVQDVIIQEDAEKENQLKLKMDKLLKRRSKNETKLIVAYALINPINFILEEERIDNKYLGKVKKAIKILISSSLIEKRDNDQARIISMDENRIVEIKLGINQEKDENHRTDEAPLCFKSIYKEKVHNYNDKNTLYDCINNNANSKNKKNNDNNEPHTKKEKNGNDSNNDNEPHIEEEEVDDDNDNNDDNNDGDKLHTKNEKIDDDNNNKNDNDEPFVDEKQKKDDEFDIIDFLAKNDILLSEGSNNLFAIERNKIPGINLNAFPFRFDLHQTLFFSASTNLRPLIELNKANDNKILKLSFYDKNKNETAILREETGKFLIFNAFSKSGDYPMFKVKLSDNKDDDVPKVYILWNYEETVADLLVQSEMPTYETNVDEKTITILSSKLLCFDDDEPCIKLINTTKKINPLEKRITLH